MREELISLMETLCGNCIPPFSLFLGGVGEYLWLFQAEVLDYILRIP